MTASDRKLSPAILLAALGVAYGDIGTSPLYAFKESLAGEHGVGVAPDAVFGVLSMIFWAVTLIVSIKYMLLVLRADNDGEGGILALLALVLRQVPAAGRRPSGGGWRGSDRRCDVLWRMRRDARDFCALGGRGTASRFAALAPYVIPLTLIVLIALFALQSRGTATCGPRVRDRSCWCGSSCLARSGSGRSSRTRRCC